MIRGRVGRKRATCDARAAENPVTASTRGHFEGFDVLRPFQAPAEAPLSPVAAPRNGREESTIQRSTIAHFIGKRDVPEEHQAAVTPDCSATIRASARKSR